VNRIASVSLRVVLATLAAAVAPHSPARADEANPDADLRLAGRTGAPVAERLAAARRLVDGFVPDAEAGVRAAAFLLADDPVVAAGLLRRSLDADVIPVDTLERARGAARGALAKATDPARRASIAAFALGLGLRGEEFEPALYAPTAPGVEAALVADAFAPAAGVASTAPEGAALLRAAFAEHRRVADLLDAASADAPDAMRAGMDGLTKLGADAVPALIRVARQAPTKTPPGRIPRRVRAIVALGLIGDRRAVDTLLPCVDDLKDVGWVRAAAAAALGDLGDPRALPALCRVLFYLGDVHRPRDSWDYPGADNTDVPAERWDTVEYYAVDCAAADAMIRLGVANAAEWLIRERLHPRSGRWRIRVLQDAVDALRRSFPDAPRDYEPDAGLPARARAYDRLVAWWRTGPRLAHPLDETDAGFRAGAKAIVDLIGARSVMEGQITKRAATLIGPPMLPTILEALAAAKPDAHASSKRNVQRAELALVLGTLGDRRAIDPLLELTRDPVPAVRGNAILALGRFVETDADPRLAGEAKDATARITARAIELLGDAHAAPRTAALQTLAHARPSADVLAAMRAHAAADHPENAFGDYRMAEDVVRLVQTGEGLDAVLAQLAAPDLFVRRFEFELLRSAFDLEPDLFDPAVDPGTPRFRPFDREILVKALARRRDGK